MGQLMRARGRHAARVGLGSNDVRRRENLGRAVAQWVESLESRRFFTAVVTTDQPDYAPGSTARITASNDAHAGLNFTEGEAVQFRTLRINPIDGSEETLAGSEPWVVTDGIWSLDGGNTTFIPYVENGVRYAPDLDKSVNGNIDTSWYVDPVYLGATLELKATGLTSGATATTQFTDGNSVKLSISPATRTVVAGNSTTYILTGTRDGASNDFSRTLTTTGLPAGVTASFSPSTWSFTEPDEQRTSTLTLNVAASVPANTYPFTVQFTDTVSQDQLVNGTLVVLGANVAPVITLPGGPLNYTENDPPTVIDAGATATDADSANLAGGTLTVDYTANGSADDRLAIRNQGTAAGQIGVSGSSVTFGGTTVGTFTGGSTTPLVVTFDASATPAAVQALMRNVTFGNVSDTPSTTPRTVRFVLTDGDGGTSNAATKTINVASVNDAPTVAADNASVTVSEGSPASNTGTYADVDGGNVAISASVGTITKTGTTSGTWSWSYTPGDGPDASQTVTITANDGNGGVTTTTFALAVNNVAPAVTAAANQAADEGQSKSFNLGSFTDPAGPSDQPYVVTVDWGDGSPLTTFTAANPGSLGAQNHTYADNGNYTVTVSVTEDDGDGATGSATFTVAVANVAPAIAISGGAPSVNEGTNFNLTLGPVTDPGTDTVAQYVVHWGDGSSDTYTSNGVKTHVYADGPDAYAITVDLVDEDGTHLDAANALGVTVDNVAPSIAINGDATVGEGSPYTLNLGAVTDPGDDTVTSYVVHWGDGNSDTYTSDGDVTHTYLDGPNSYDITVDLVDEEGTYLNRANAHSVSVLNVAPQVTAPANQSADEGESKSFNLGSFTDPADASDQPYAVSVDWGDGSPLTTFSVANPGSLGSQSHAYADNGSYTVTVTVTEEAGDGASGSASFTASVANVAPTLTLSGAASVNEAAVYTLNLASSDPGADTITSWTINWGDGNTQVVTGNLSSVTHTYADDEPGAADDVFTISATATDEDGTHAAQNTLDVTVVNLNPSISDVTNDGPVNEGSPVGVSVTATDPAGVKDPLKYSFDFNNDGDFTDPGDVLDSSSNSASFTFADDGSYTVGVRVTDGDGGVATGSTVVTVDNVAPTIVISGDATVEEGSPYSLTLGAVTDPGDDTVSQYVVHWGDGSSDTYTSGGVVSHTYADGPATYDVTVDLVDEDGTHLDAANALQVEVENVAPTVAADNATVTVDEGATALNSGTYADPGEDTVELSASVGTIIDNRDGTWSWSLDTADGPDDSGTVTIRAIDSDGEFAETTFELIVNNVAPTLTTAGAASVDEAATYTLSLSAADPGNDTITGWIINWGDGDVQVVTGNPPSVTHAYDDGPANYTISAKASDEDGTFDAQNTVDLTVNNVDPTATPNAYVLSEDGSASGNLVTDDTGGGGADSDPAGANDPLTVSAVNGSAAAVGNAVSTSNGTVTVNANGSFTYTPDADFFGTDSFTYTISDGDGGTSTATVTLTVTEVNDPPVAHDDSAETNEDTDATGNVLTNDTDADNDDGIPGNEDTLTVTAYSQGAHGAVVVNADGSYTYTPDANFFGTDSFTYTVSDGRDGTDTGTVNVTVTEVNDAPVATADEYTTDEDNAVSGNVLDNDTDPDNTDGYAGNEDDLDAVLVSGPSNGSLSLDAETGAYTYTPNANFFGSDSFTYYAVDGDRAQSSTVTVTISVSEVNDAPEAVNDSASTNQDTAVSGNVLVNDTDPDNTDGTTGNEDTLTVTAYSQGAHGTVVVNPDGSYTYTPNLGYSGTDSFTYTISDGIDTDTATVNINVAAADPGSVYLRDDECLGGQMLIVNGSSGADNIHLAPATGGGVTVYFNGVAQGTYAFTGRIVVFGYAGDDQITIAGAVPNVAWLYGDDGHDLLNLGNGGGIAWGGNGNDHINGGSGVDIMVGGEGADRIVGNAGDDILAAGYTKFDNRFSATSNHQDAWCHIYKEWSRRDLATTSVVGDSSYTAYEQRIDHLKGTLAGGYNGGYFLNNLTVDDDNDYDQIDMLTGSAGEDWFIWTKGEDKVTGMSATEGAEDLDNIS